MLNNWPKLQLWLASLLVVGLLAGGGLATYILHSDGAWYWPSPTAVRVNKDARRVMRYVVPRWGTDYKPYWQSSFEF